MEDMNGGASAPAETTTVAADQVTPPAPINSEPPKAPEPKPEPKTEEKKAPTAREALKAAAEKVAEKAKTEAADADKKTAPVQSQPKPGEKAAEKTLPDPKPAKAAEAATTTQKPVETPAKPAQTGTHHDAPARFKSDAAATAEWEKAPEAVKAAVHRTFREMEAGIEKHRASADEFEKVRDFHDLATKNKTTLRDAMTRYTNFERALLTDPMKGLNMVCDYIGVSLRDVAAHVMGQKPEQAQSQNDATIRELRNEIAALKQSVGGVTTTMQEQHVAGIEAQVQQFKASHPRFDDLAEDIAFFIKSGKTNDLAEAYSLAERLNPAPASTTTTVTAAPQTRTAPDPLAQTQKGSKSITGAPSAGSDPATKRASSSIKDALRRAVAQAG